MAAETALLDLVTPTQGTLTGAWGDTVNNGITEYVDIAIAGTLTLTGDGAVTLANTTGDASATNIVSSLTGAGTVTAQFAIVKVSGTLTTAKVVTAPSGAGYSKTYTVVNSATGGIVTFKASGQTGVSIAVGETAFVYFNGTDYVKVVGTATAGAAAGSNTQVQYNSSGALAGSSNLTWNGSSLAVTGALSATTSAEVNGTYPKIYLIETDAATDNKQWWFESNAGVYQARVLNDAVNVATTWLSATRSGATITQVALNASTGGYVYQQINGTPVTTVSSTGMGIGRTPVANGSFTVLDVAGASGGFQRWVHTGSSVQLQAYASSTLTAVGSVTNHPLLFVTNDTERARVDTAGYLSGVWADEVTALGTVTTAGSIVCTSGNVFTATLGGNCTFTLSAASSTTASTATSFTLILTNDGTAGRTVSWAGGTFLWPGGAASLSRTTTANATDIWFFFSPNGGTTWYGNISQKNLIA